MECEHSLMDPLCDLWVLQSTKMQQWNASSIDMCVCVYIYMCVCVYIYIYVLSLFNVPPTSYPSRFLESRFESLSRTADSHWLSVLHMVVYILPLFSSFSPPFRQPMSISLFSMSALPFLPCKQVHQYHLSRFYIYALIHNICFSHSDSVQFIHLCPTLCDPMDCRPRGLPVHHQLPEFIQAHVR